MFLFGAQRPVRSTHGAVLADNHEADSPSGSNRRSCVLGKPRWRGCNWGWKVKTLPSTKSLLGVLGDTETGDVATHLTLPFWKYGVGRWERCNISPTGGRQHDHETTWCPTGLGNGMRGNGVMLGDDQHAKGSFVLQNGRVCSARQIGE